MKKPKRKPRPAKRSSLFDHVRFTWTTEICDRPIRKVYLVGSLRNPKIPAIAELLRASTGLEIFDDWFAAGPHADDAWRDYEMARGRTYAQALEGLAARHVFEFDDRHLDEAHAGVIVLPAGRSGHMEIGVLRGERKPIAILLDKPDRWDVMYRFADLVTTDLAEITAWLKRGAPRRAGVR